MIRSTMALLALVSTSSSASASLLGGIYHETPGSVASLTTATGDVNAQTPAEQFNSTLVNGGFQYGGTDLATTHDYLTNDNSTVPDTTPFRTTIIDMTGSLIVPVGGQTLTFNTTNSDDGSSFYLDGTPGTSGSGTSLANNDGNHGGQNASSTVFVPAGTHPLELIYWNTNCPNNDCGGQITASIVDSVGAAVTVVPEPSSPLLIGLSAAGLALVAVRRRRPIA